MESTPHSCQFFDASFTTLYMGSLFEDNQQNWCNYNLASEPFYSQTCANAKILNLQGYFCAGTPWFLNTYAFFTVGPYIMSLSCLCLSTGHVKTSFQSMSL